MIVTTTENIAGYKLEIPKVVSIIDKLKMNPLSYELWRR